MNLHIVTDSSISATFYRNLEALGLSGNNRVVVRSNNAKVKHFPEGVFFGKLYSPAFRSAVGDTRQYDRVFIHQFSPLMYRWVAMHEFRELNWMVWGTDLYNLPGTDFNFYEPLTWQRYVSHDFSSAAFLFKLKVWLTNSMFRKKAYAKVDNVYTWMHSEYQFACDRLPTLRAKHKYFFYVNDVPYHKLDEFLAKAGERSGNRVSQLLVGNSGTPTNNHFDTVTWLQRNDIKADLFIPAAYGDKHYISFLKKNLSFYTGGKITFVDQYMSFGEYVMFLLGTDGLIMNTIRPQGYGNIFMMLYLGLPVFMNERNISLPDLEKSGIAVNTLQDLKDIGDLDIKPSREAILGIFSQERMVEIYRLYFS